MQSTNDLWEELGALSEEDSVQVLMKLFTAYETEKEQKSPNSSYPDFFQKLHVALEQTSNCNLNRR